MKITLVIIILIGIIAISSVIWYTQPKEVREDISKAINKSISEIMNKTKEVTQPPATIENKSIAINETKAKEIEVIINTTKIPESDKEVIKEQFLVEKWIPIIVKVKSFELIDTVINSVDTREFKLISKTEFKEAIPTFSGNATKDAIIKLQNNTYVERIYYDYPTKSTLQDSISLINVNKVWQIQLNGLNITGQPSDRNITICVIDTGVNYTHPDLGGCPPTNNINTAGCSKVIGGYDYNAFPDDDDPMDIDGHGTHVAGIVAANGSIKGVATDAKLVALRATGVTNIKNAIDWCVNNRIIYNISIITISQAKVYPNGTEYIFSSNCDGEDAMVDTANNARQYGIFLDAASGNSGSKVGITDPACGSNVTSVGATYDSNVGGISFFDSNGNLICTDSTTVEDKTACFTNKASILDLLAPGSIINSTNYTGNPLYSELSGTSQAAPHVAGIAALMKQVNSSLSPAEIENILKKTGRPVYDGATNITFPRIDAYKAVLASYNDLIITDLQELSTNLTTKIFEFKIMNSINTTTNNISWKLNTGDGYVVNSNPSKNITLGPYEELFVQVMYNYSNFGTYNVTVTAYSMTKSFSDSISAVVASSNLKVQNLTILNLTSSYRVFEFVIKNDGQVNQGNIYWRLNVSNDTVVDSTNPIILQSGKDVFVQIEYNYTTAGSHSITAIVDPNNSITETNETDNEIMITDP